MPELMDAISARAWRRRTVASALARHAWIWDITGALTITVLMQYLQLRQQLDTVSLTPEVEDWITWKWSSSGQYSSSSRCFLAPRSCGRLGLQMNINSSSRSRSKTGAGPQSASLATASGTMDCVHCADSARKQSATWS
jgi:hypothetical protein